MNNSTEWRDIRLKNLFISVRNGVWGDDPDEETDIFCARGTDFDRATSRISDSKMPRRNVIPSVLREHQLQRGDLVLEKSGGSADQPVGSAALFDLPIRAVCSNFNARLQVHDSVDPRFACYLMNSLYWSGFTRQFIKQTTGIQNLDANELLAQHCVLAPLNEQRRIADFLDAETARIDLLAALRTSQMEALTARYQSQLSETAQVLCDRYGAVKVRYVLQKIEQGWSPQCEDRTIRNGEWGVVKAGCVNGGVFDATQHKALPAGIEPELRYRLHSGDLLISRASGSVDLIGSVASLPDDLPSCLLLCDKVYRLRMDRTRMTPYFVAYMLRTLEVREQIKLGISGAEGMANNLPTATVTNLPLPDVPLPEQVNVVSDLDNAWQAVQNATHVLKQQLAVLSERRRALITAAVTGEIDVATVRGVAV